MRVIFGMFGCGLGLLAGVAGGQDSRTVTEPVIPASYLPETYLKYPIPGFGLIVALFGLTLAGATNGPRAGTENRTGAGAKPPARPGTRPGGVPR